jgi:rhodanese-related sulfurtransferase
MVHKRKLKKLTTVLLILVVLISPQAFGQNNKLTVYESPEQMVAAAKEVITEIPVEDFKNIYTRDDIFIIDVRTSAEHNEAAVPGAVNIPRGVLEFRIGQEETWESAGATTPGKDDPIIVYCGSGSRGALSAKALMQLGYNNVKSVKGGWGAWHEAYPEIRE